MSSTPTPTNTPASPASNADRRQYYCHECQHTTLAAAYPSGPHPECALCRSQFIEERAPQPQASLQSQSPPQPQQQQQRGQAPSPQQAQRPAAAAAASSQHAHSTSYHVFGGMPQNGTPGDWLHIMVEMPMVLARQQSQGGTTHFMPMPMNSDFLMGLLHAMHAGHSQQSGTPPASKAAVDALVKTHVTQEQCDAQLDCAVCLEQYTTGEQVTQLPCKHAFHESCVMPWLKIHSTCPSCRNQLQTDANAPAAAASAAHSAAHVHATTTPIQDAEMYH